MSDVDVQQGQHSGSETEERSDLENEAQPAPPKPINISPGAMKLRSWLNKALKIEMTDGRTLIGVFLCTDRDANIILGSCSEYLPADACSPNEEPRMLGLVMIPGKHIVSVHIDLNEYPYLDTSSGLSKNIHGEVS